MIKIGITEVKPENACSYYRSFGTLGKLKNVSLVPLKEINWLSLNSIDILFIGRPDHKNYVELLRIAKDLNIPTWIDWDDNVLVLPEYNPAYAHFNSRKQEVIDCIKLADIVTVSTEDLKSQLSQYNGNIHIIENAFNNYNYDFIKQESQVNEVFWRGSNTHRGDLMTVHDEMVSVSNKFNDWIFLFVGGDAWYVADKIKNSAKGASVDILSYNKFLKYYPHSIMQVPLEDNSFNRSKSNIAWIEGTFNGCATIAQGLPEFCKPGVVTYDTPDKYQYYLEKLMGSKEYRLKQYNESFEYIKENLMLTEMNKKRIKIIERLI